jgi:hypothetical protein
VCFFAVCCRSWHTANILHCRVSTALPCIFFVAHGKQDLCRVPLNLLCVAFVAHGKYALCRVPEIVHTAKIPAHGKLRVSGSVLYMSFKRKSIHSTPNTTTLQVPNTCTTRGKQQIGHHEGWSLFFWRAPTNLLPLFSRETSDDAQMAGADL